MLLVDAFQLIEGDRYPVLYGMPLCLDSHGEETHTIEHVSRDNFELHIIRNGLLSTREWLADDFVAVPVEADDVVAH